MNPSWERVLGWSPDELRALPLASFVHPDDVSLLQALLDMPSSVAGDAPPLACRMRARDGSYRLLAPSVSGAAGALGFSARDITAQAAIEDRVRWTRVYRDAIRLFTSSLPPGFTRGSVIRPWMPARSHGVECIGNPLRLERIIARYAPSGSVPF